MANVNKISMKINKTGIGDDHPVRVMGVLNVSKESFYKESYVSEKQIAGRAEAMVEAGATFLDVGGRSTAPNSPAISIETEKERVETALSMLLEANAAMDALISVDTQHEAVATGAMRILERHGARERFVLNDVSGLSADPSLASWVIDNDVPAILMATRQVPGDSLGIKETTDALKRSLSLLEREDYDIKRKVIIDPAIGRWIPEKEPPYDLELIGRLEEFRALGQPMLVAISRKSFLGAVLGEQDPADRLQGTLAATAIAVFNGAHVVRTHDVNKETMDTILLATEVRRASGTIIPPGVDD